MKEEPSDDFGRIEWQTTHNRFSGCRHERWLVSFAVLRILSILSFDPANGIQSEFRGCNGGKRVMPEGAKNTAAGLR